MFRFLGLDFLETYARCEGAQDFHPCCELVVDIPGNAADFNIDGIEIYNKDGIRIVAKALHPSDSEYSKDIYALLLVENNSGKTISIADKYNSLSVNDFMMDYYRMYDTEVDNGAYAVLNIELMESSLEENKITSISDITKVEISLDIKDENGRMIDDPAIVITY